MTMKIRYAESVELKNVSPYWFTWAISILSIFSWILPIMLPKILATGSHRKTLIYLASQTVSVCCRPSNTDIPKIKGPSMARIIK